MTNKRAQFRLSYSVVEQGGVRGRPKEVATLKKLYHDSAQVSKVLIVEGKAGVGKTALITSQQTNFFNDCGHFVSGTFDQQRKSEPFSAIVDALHELFEELLSEEYSLDDNSAVKTIMEQFAKESKNDAGMKAVLQNAIPKFAELVQAKNAETRLQQEAFDMSGHSFGKNKAKRSVSTKGSSGGSGSQQPRRTSSGYKKRGWNFEKLKISLRLLLRCICSPKRRVVIFLDDLHYADPSSLEMIEFLASGDGLSPIPDNDADQEHDRVRGLLLILAYRNVSSKPNSKEGAITIGHPFRTRLKELKQMKCPIHRIHVKDLDLEAVNEIVSTVTRHSGKPETTMPLSQVIYKKTGGNPFSVLHTLEYLEHQELVYFNLSDYQWKWKNVRTIHSATDLSDNIVDMVAKKFQSLPRATQEILMLASCLGSYFRLEVIAAYFRKHNDKHKNQDFAAALKESEEMRGSSNGNGKSSNRSLKDSAGLIVPDDDQSVLTINGAKAKHSTLLDTMIKLLELPLQQDMLTKRRKSTTYFFAHERLQTVAYSLLPDDGKTRKEIHWRLGKLMKEKSQQFPEEHWMAYLATDQLNRGLVFLSSDTSERVELATMNLHIALMSQEKSAFCPAAEFLRSAIRLLFHDEKTCSKSGKKKQNGIEDPVPKAKANPSPAPTTLYTCSRDHYKNVWGKHYELCLDLFSSLAEMEYLLGNHKASKEAVEEVLKNAREEEDKFRAQVILIESISAQRDFENAIETCLKILAVAHDMKLSSNPMKLQIMNEKKKVNKMLEQQIQLDESRGSLDFNDSSGSFASFGNASFNSMSSSTRSQSTRTNPVAASVTAKPHPVQRVKSAMPDGWANSSIKPGSISRVKTVGSKPNIPKNDTRFGAAVPKNEGRFRKAVASEASKITSFFHKKSEKAMMTLPKMTDDKAIRVSKLLSQLMLNAILSGKTDLSAYIGLRSIRFSFQHGISPHSPMALAAYGISQAKEGKYNEAFANGMLALKLLDVADSKEWYTRTILKCHNLRHIKKPFHESLDPMMEGYRTGIESGDMEYALVAAMHYSLLYMFVGLPVGPLEPDLMAFAEQVHRYHLPFVLEVTFYIYREFLLDLQGEEHDKISLDGDNQGGQDSMDRSVDGSVSTMSQGPMVEATNIDKRVKPLVQREMCVMNLQKCYIFGEFEEAEKMMHQLGELPKFDYSVLRTINRDTFFGLVNFALAKSTGKKKYKERGRKIIEELETYVKNGSVNTLHILTLLQAEDASLNNSDWFAVTKAYDEAIKCAARAGFTNHEAIGNERAGRFLVDLKAADKKAKDDDVLTDQAKSYISRAMALYREWGATAKVDQLEEEFPQLQPSKLLQGSNVKARRRFSRTLTARFRDMKLHSGRWSVGASSDLKILDGFDDLRGDQPKNDNSNVDPYGFAR